MNELKKWAKDKPYIIKIFAAHLVSTVQDMAEEYKTIKLRRFSWQKFPLPHLPSWFALYRSHRKVDQTIKDIWASVYGKTATDFFSGLLDEAQQLKNQEKKSLQSLPTQEEVEKSFELLQMILSASDKALEEEINQVPVKQTAQRRMAKLIANKPLELSFYLFVAAPCWTLYRMSPTRLYRQARQGNFDALERLLRLDQLMLHDPAIGKQIITYRFNHSMSKYRKLLKAATDPPTGKKSSYHILLSQIGFISALSHLTSKPLTPRDLYELIAAFDADCKTNYLHDLPDDPGNFARGLAPDRNLWRQLLNSDK
ncbi:hypothetical protein KIP69_06820 [Geobacter sulfurreducens]|uniref:hypothetical protein n=1 Tax=Geobacter sulfurreducens TaxID=35554 RepID=UPI001BDC720B|nr:hypothetical protein [Geobacter sulfurreducens]QVW36551.1 hypothetical protein KIP69_06820 [Geobacter sulfurreducens]